MLGCAGGFGIVVYDGGFRRRIVSATITRTGRASSPATSASPVELGPAHVGLGRSRGAERAARLRVKQLPLPTPAASARSARPLPLTAFSQIVLPRARQGGPGSGPPEKSTKRAVGKTAMP